MNHFRKTVHAARKAGLSLTLCASSALATGAFAAWLLSLSGTRGLVEWMPLYRNVLIAIFFSGWIPIPFAIAGKLLLKSRKAPGKAAAGRVLSACAIFLAGALTLAGLASLAGYPLIIKPEKGTHRVALTVSELEKRLSEKVALRTTGSGVDSGTGVDSGAKSEGNPLLRIAVSSDPHYGNPRSDGEATARILKTVNGGHYDAFFILGDIAETGAPGLALSRAAATLAQALPDVPLATVMGNHDSILGGERTFRALFTDKPWYRVDAGPVHLVALDLLWGAETFSNEQKRWLEKTLKSIPKEDTTIVLSHAFYWSSGYIAESGKNWADNWQMIEKLCPIFERNGVDVVVSGHNHFMESLASPRGDTDYEIIGAMGGYPDRYRTFASAASRWFSGTDFGFLEISVYKNKTVLVFRDRNGDALHSVTR